ncbi:TIGR04283 family arsenosugar biosynthesis glycosyltransferase [Roseateles sp.]|uniref:TIGR04283 family arsenosugar biosynthesis glycosyltransferase n=1 Tax=Roseateles sp. TaxID=1971397 RepID=UPI00286D1FA1|nr:TIGR04283 family arsenosugar biosynthesis glycosyltransferase [Roseateles sp.]
MKAALSIVIPALNEAAGIAASLQALQTLRGRGVELILVDGGSADDTVERARPWADIVITAARGRALQMNAGAARSQGEVLLFLHADTELPPAADQLILSAIEAGASWGRFDVHISGAARLLRVVALMMNWRSRLSGIATGDQAMFVRREVFERLGGFPAQPLMEDVELSKRLGRLARPACLRAKVRTSGRRWESRGLWRTIWLMWSLRWRYWRGEPAESLARAYR